MNISFVVRNGLCTGCGTCVGVCPQSAIKMRKREGLYLPLVDSSKCQEDKGCDICLRVCPGYSIDIDKNSEELFPEAEKDFYLGRTLSCFTGYSTDYEIRYHSASGGIVSQLLIFMLENNIVDGALVTRMKSKDPLEPESFIATTKEEILQAKSSKYCPVSMNTLIRDLKKREGKFAVVGLPCHIHGFRKAEKFFPFLKEKIALYLGILCSSTRNFLATRYLLGKYQLGKTDVLSFTYRDEGWMGDLIVKMKNHDTRRVPFLSYYPQLRSFFIPFRCTLCVDYCAELADISLGDIYSPEYWSDKIGTSVIIDRSIRGLKILRKAENANKIVLNKIAKEIFIKAQKRMMDRKKKHFFVRSVFVRLFLRKPPLYGLNSLSVSAIHKLKYFISAIILYLEIIIGKHKFLWPFISKLNNNAEVFGERKENNSKT
jgi:coenzyme F420 hydrogenase subunit beta